MVIKKIAVLLTCHNRKAKTLESLKSLYLNKVPSGYTFDVFLVDDGSTDGTAEAVKEEFPKVNIITGNGNLFWNQGMRLAWKTAANSNAYDFYLWLNDDTIIEPNSLNHLFDCYEEIIAIDEKPSIMTGACYFFSNEKKFSYGGRTEAGPVIPNGKLQKCKYINGNIVLIPKLIHDQLGNLSSDYTHGMGDYDYGLRAINKGFNCYTTKEYVANCPPNEGIPGWCNPELSLTKRWKQLHSPLGLNIKEYNTFRKKFWGQKWILFALKAYAKMISPKTYSKISN
ncbi:glycosyltransferase family 2 protein [Algibacter lectus]|uniref:GT2 family glycosyltransferase n=1 Tax=Algibacter lectus TaxID=221126 RepID=A0A4R8M5M9_9FLAO|nr:glycosyltransferase family 2 protein [Algibacter lectus]MWW25907.1 glycosyltransferase [Algibacter lectus]TDY60633.1 GT2 family glycosyltransferase [Algibacter lectus]